MAISASNRRKGLEKSQRLITDATATWYSVGRTGPNSMLAGLALVGGSLGLCLVILVATGALVIVGALPLLVIFHFLCPPRALVVCDRGVALTGRSLLNGTPTSVIGRYSISDLRPTTSAAGRVRIDVGPEHVWLPTAEEQQLRAAIGHLMSAAPV
jgi:hypothetical protein